MHCSVSSVPVKLRKLEPNVSLTQGFNLVKPNMLYKQMVTHAGTSRTCEYKYTISTTPLHIPVLRRASYFVFFTNANHSPA